jgi:hypothetical protein
MHLYPAARWQSGPDESAWASSTSATMPVHLRRNVEGAGDQPRCGCGVSQALTVAGFEDRVGSMAAPHWVKALPSKRCSRFISTVRQRS